MPTLLRQGIDDNCGTLAVEFVAVKPTPQSASHSRAACSTP